MKLIKTYLVMLLAALTFIGCKKQTSLDLSGTYTIKSSAKLFIPKNRNIATLTASDFADSRCPANAICVWEGVGTVKIKFKDEVKEQTIELCTGGCAVVSKSKAQDITLNNLNYTVELTELSPYPGTGTANSTKKATIVIKRK
ncbi:hypothetical protein EZ428_17410 [Pedobacter frigiditerrae]|uniref:Lipocalin-like domain-containing protein n=1 Tax=Pedobacter frigiditerrae TaxID=2530452 RepID=A0A4R0MRA4_9SPHI|nr:hypothetical protein [Pedobacter frigiditerrae]TCC89469.1 hypothetical protein EZ428_17410 [Pedobacter frigiditerrae]